MRTNDDTMITVKLMLFYELKDILKYELFVNFQVKDVRTNDDTMITVKLMLFYELKDILKYKAVCQLSGKRCENQ